MRRLFLAAALLFAADLGWAGGGLHLGMGSAVKRKARELDAKAKDDDAAAGRKAFLSGVAATGRPIAFAAVTVRNCGGKTASGTTGPDGAFNIDVTSVAFPVFLKVAGSSPYYSLAYGPGNVNIHPYTDLALKSFYHADRGVGDLNGAFNGNFTRLCGPPSRKNLSDVSASLMKILAPVAARRGIDPTSYNPFTGAFAADSQGFDAVLDETRIDALDLNAIKIADLGAQASFRVVTTKEDLTSALAAGGTVYVAASMTLDATAVISRDGTTLAASPLANQAVRLTYPHRSGESRSVVRVEAADAHIVGLEITTGHPLTSAASYYYDNGIQLTGSATLDISGLVIEHCRIFGVETGIRRYGGLGSKTLKGGRIVGNAIYSFSGGGIYINYRTDSLIVESNYISGRVGSQTHDVVSNGMWIGNFADHLSVRNNRVERVDRHGIEIWNSGVDVANGNFTGNANGNLDPVIEGNSIGVLGANTSLEGSFGISVIGNGLVTIASNTIEQAIAIGIEAVTDPINKARFLIVNNSILRTLSPQWPTPISINSRDAPGTMRAIVRGNVIGRSESTLAGFEQFGIQILYGCADVLIEGNTFNDAGNRPLYVNGDGRSVFAGLVIVGNTFNWSDAAPLEAYNPSVSLQNSISTVVLKDNAVFRSRPDVGYYHANSTSFVWTGGPGVIAVVPADGAVDVRGQTNRIFSY